MKRALVASAAILLLGQGTAAAETFDLYFFTYCAPGTLCGLASEQFHRERILNAVQEINVEWEVAGISFRPVILNIQEESYYSQTLACSGDVSDEIKARRQEWRADVAALHPNAISVILTTGASRCCTDPPDSPYDGDPDGSDGYPNLYGVFCTIDNPGFGLGTVLAHELGHYFCLRHTMTFNDPADNNGNPVNHDLDAQLGVNDTPADPGVAERFDANQGGWDIDMNGNPVVGHEWCNATPQSGLTDDGSPHDQVCTIGCAQFTSSGFVGINFQPHPHAGMSYYGADCRGPFVVNGVTTEAFSPDSVNQIRNVCIPQVSERAALPDVCAGHGGDTDFDGICQFEDNCQSERNTHQVDLDQDGYGNLCDLCPENPGMTGDLDGDGDGDICDDDIDGDTCENDVDDAPYDGDVTVGIAFGNCGFGIEQVTQPAWIDSDNDGVKACEDVDDDNDGVCDGYDAYPPGSTGAPNGCAAGPDGCTQEAGAGCLIPLNAPNDCQPNWQACIGGGCAEFYMKLQNVVNPAEQVVVDRFRIQNRRLYVQALPDRTVSQTARAFRGEIDALAQAPLLTTAFPPDPIRLEIWSRKTNQLVAIVGVYESSRVTLGDVTRGGWLELIPGMTPAGVPTLEVTSVYAPIPDDGAPSPDADGDGRPDFVDNCTMRLNFLQGDADGDGFGDRCDPDVDNDFLVTDNDVALVAGCDGADLLLSIPLSEPDEPGFPGSGAFQLAPDAAAIALADRCRAMDLDGDADVDSADEAIALAALGAPPGPSARATHENACNDAACDDGLACTTDYCDPSTGQCLHVAGDCDDGNPCTTDSCDMASGQCINDMVVCDDLNPCTRDACDPLAGGCTTRPERNGIACSDGSMCTLNDVCQAGQCSGTPKGCADGNPCTVDSCNPATGQCFFPPTVCDDGNPCTQDVCAATGACSHSNLPDNATCSDGDLCTQGDRCTAGVCSGPPVTCSDGDLCTLDSCDPATGACLHPPDPCDDADACTIDSCDPATGGCLHPPVVFTEPALSVLGDLVVTWPGQRITQGHWNSYRGTIPSGMMGSRGSPYDQICLDSADMAGDGGTTTLDPFVPPPGTAYYYVVTHETGCGEGPPLRDSAGTPGPNPNPCLTPP